MTKHLSAGVFWENTQINSTIINMQRPLQCFEKRAAYKNSISSWMGEQWDSWVLLVQGHSYFPSSIQHNITTTTLDALRLWINIWSFLINITKHTVGQWQRAIHQKITVYIKKYVQNKLKCNSINLAQRQVYCLYSTQLCTLHTNVSATCQGARWYKVT